MATQVSDTSLANISSAPLRGKRPRRRDGRSATLMMAPNMIMFTIFVFVPIIGGVLLSLAQWNISVGGPKWVGLANYKTLFADPLVGQAVETTLKFLLFGVVPTVVISLGLAMLINCPLPLRRAGAHLLPDPRRHVASPLRRSSGATSSRTAPASA